VLLPKDPRDLRDLFIEAEHFGLPELRKRPESLKKKLAAAGSILVDELNRWIQIGPQKHIILGAISWGTSTHGGCRRRILAKRKIAQMLSVFSSSAGRFFLMWQWEIPKKHGAVNAEFEIWNFPLPHLTTHGAQLHFQEY